MRNLREWIAGKLKRRRRWSTKEIAAGLKPESLERYRLTIEERTALVDPERAKEVVRGIEAYDQTEIQPITFLAWRIWDGKRLNGIEIDKLIESDKRYQEIANRSFRM